MKHILLLVSVTFLTSVAVSAAGKGGTEEKPPTAAAIATGGLSPEELNVLKADSELHLAFQARNQNDLKECERHLGKILALKFPDTPDAQHLLGGTYLLMAELQMADGKLQKAHESADLATQKCQKQPCVILSEAYKLLSKIARTQKNVKEARDYLQKSVDVLGKLRK